MNEKLKTLLYFWLPVVLWMSFIFSLSSVPGGRLPQVQPPQFNKTVHQTVHFFEYSILGALLVRAFLRSKSNKISLGLLLGAVAVALLFGLSDEWHQSFTPGRTCKLDDVLLDVASSISGILLFLISARKADNRRLS